MTSSKNNNAFQLEMSGEHNNRRLKKYAEYSVGPDAVDSVQFLDDKRFLVVNNKEVGPASHRKGKHPSPEYMWFHSISPAPEKRDQHGSAGNTVIEPQGTLCIDMRPLSR